MDSSGMLLPYALAVKGFGIFAGVEHMGAVVCGKVVCTGEVLFCTHIYIVGCCMVQHGIDA